MKELIFSATFLLCAVIVSNCRAQGNKDRQVRKPAVAGSFYPSDIRQLKIQLETFFKETDDKTVDENIAALIVPHAGYIFSGEVAASAYAQLAPEKAYARIFIIGTSHHMQLNGASIYNQGDYETPLGRVQVDIDLAQKLIRQNTVFSFETGAHSNEHSLEVQLPFLQYHLKKPFKIIPIIIGTQSVKNCEKIAAALRPYFSPENLFVISSDFSHYPSYTNAIANDKLTGEAIASNSPQKFLRTITESPNIPGLLTSCCGWSSILTLLNISSAIPGIAIKHIKYMNSGDSSYGDKKRVVGYHAFSFTLKNASSSSDSSNEFVLTQQDKKQLLKLARQAIESQLNNMPIPKIDEKNLSQAMKTHCGAFVTLNKRGRLRGCIGHIKSKKPLYKVVQEVALSSAFRDMRFEPITKSELENIEIEISVLTPLKRIYSAKDFKLGQQGIYMIKGNQSGTFLPQVAEKTNWSKEEFLGHCARDKAGIEWNGWKNAELYTYEALIFREKDSRP